MIQENNRIITTKKGKGKLPLFNGNGEQVITIYALDKAFQTFQVKTGDNEPILNFGWQFLCPYLPWQTDQTKCQGKFQ